jgi:hypothetical protein
MKPTNLTDKQLIERVKKLCAANARFLANLITDLIDLEERRVHLQAACSSMREYCIRHLDMSPSQAWRRTTAARLVQRVPAVLEYVRRGEIDLSTLVLLRHFITQDNADELIRATRCRSKRQVERYLESRQPKRDGARTETAPGGARSSVLERLEAISGELHMLEAAIADETRILIERARHLLKKAMPNATLGDLVHRAFSTLVETLEAAVAEARGVKRVQRPPVKTGYIPRAVRYAVFMRDGFRCTFTSATGERCRATRHLELDHIVARAHGGKDEPENLRCACRAHNQHYAEEAFGKQFIRDRVRERQSKGRDARTGDSRA